MKRLDERAMARLRLRRQHGFAIDVELRRLPAVREFLVKSPLWLADVFAVRVVKP
jgi:hypothetical protein